MKHTQQTKDLLRIKSKLQNMDQGPNKGCFKKGNKPHNVGLPAFGGIQVMQHDCVYIHMGNGKRERRPKLVWEQHHGPVPKGRIIYHINGNKYDDRIENLTLITRGQLMKLNAGRACFQDGRYWG